MGDFSSSTQVKVGEQVLFEYLSDVSNLPKYFARMKSATMSGPEEVDTEAEVNGQTVRGPGLVPGGLRQQASGMGLRG